MCNSCIKKEIFCNKPQEDNNSLKVDLNEKKFGNNESSKYPKEKGINNNNNNEVTIFNIQSKFRSKLFKNNINSYTLKSSLKSKKDRNMNELNKYKQNNENFDKLIHFTNINERKLMNTSVSTSNIK